VPIEQDVRIYATRQGREPFTEWLQKLDRAVRTKVRTRLDRISLGNFGDHRALDDGVFELRIHFGAGYRIYFGREGNTIVILLYGGAKGSQSRDIERAKEYWRDYRSQQYGKT